MEDGFFEMSRHVDSKILEWNGQRKRRTWTSRTRPLSNGSDHIGYWLSSVLYTCVPIHLLEEIVQRIYIISTIQKPQTDEERRITDWSVETSRGNG